MHADVASICVAALGEAPLSLRQIRGAGIVNAVFDVETRQGRLVFRIQFDSPLDGVFHKEAWCLEQARAVGVPGPDVVAIGVHEGHAYSVHTWQPGIVGSAYRGDVEEVWRAIGRHARRFHEVEARGFGEHVGGAVGDDPDTTLAGWVDSWNEIIFGSPLLVDRGLLSAHDFEAARGALSRIKGWSGVPRLCHGNLSLDNVIVDGGEVAILDWGTAAGHLAPELDLAELHVWSTDPKPPHLPPFLVGYGLSRAEHAALRPKLELLEIWRALSSAHWMLTSGRGSAELVDLLGRKLRALL